MQFSECSTQAEHDPAMLKNQPNQQEIKGSNEPAGADEQRQLEEAMLGSPQSLTPQHEAAVASQAPTLMASGIWQHPAELPQCQKTRNNTQQEGKKQVTISSSFSPALTSYPVSSEYGFLV